MGSKGSRRNSLGIVLQQFAAITLTLFVTHVTASTAIVGGQIIDGLSDDPLDENVILVKENRIVAIGDSSIIPDDAVVVDLGDMTIMPGLIDCHTHPLMQGDDYQLLHLQHSSAYKALKAMKSLQNLLNAGWTTVRVMGDSDVFYANQDINRVIEEGVFQGPRIYGAAHYISTTAGGGDIRFISAEQQITPDGLIVDGVDEVRKAVRTEIKYGSDWIKLLVTGAFLSAGDSPTDVHFSQEELDAAIAEANRFGVPVAAHAHATEGIRMAVEAGVRSIEHGTYLDRVTSKLMKEKGTFLVPTIYIGDHVIEEDDDIREKEVNLDYYNNYRQPFLDAIGEAHRIGVKIAVGVDFGGYNYDPTVSVRELAVLVEAGMTPMEAIKAGTSVGAELLQKEDEIGSLQVGHLADIIAVPGNPLHDMTVLERVAFVMKDGELIKQPAK